MFLSIITINRNNAKGLKKTLESVASQTCRDFEHIIIDGASTDGSVDIIKEYVASPAGKNISYWISELDSGTYNAMNKGVHYASGNYCLFLNSGDWLYSPSVLEETEKITGIADIIYFDPVYVFSNKQIRYRSPEVSSLLMMFLHGININHQNMITKTSIQKANPFNEQYAIYSDFDFNIKNILINRYSFYHEHKTLAYYEASEGLSSRADNSSIIEKEKKEILDSYFSIDLQRDYNLLYEYEYCYARILSYMRRIFVFLKKKLGLYHYDFHSNDHL